MKWHRLPSQECEAYLLEKKWWAEELGQLNNFNGCKAKYSESHSEEDRNGMIKSSLKEFILLWSCSIKCVKNGPRHIYETLPEVLRTQVVKTMQIIKKMAAVLDGNGSFLLLINSFRNIANHHLEKI